jgi:hypothetical protein
MTIIKNGVWNTARKGNFAAWIKNSNSRGPLIRLLNLKSRSMEDNKNEKTNSNKSISCRSYYADYRGYFCFALYIYTKYNSELVVDIDVFLYRNRKYVNDNIHNMFLGIQKR